MSFAAGSLVRARQREWVVLPGSDDELLLVKPLGGTDDEVTGILRELESVQAAQFALPDPEQIGDYRSARLLRDALRLGFRSSAGPFRSVARIAVEPRAYQLVPLLMALKLDPVRLLIADDVGIGKTVEAGLIAKELLESGDARKLCVLCPPHLAEQWQAELASKFHIDAQLVLASTAARLERAVIGHDRSIFDVHDHVVVSIDFIKSDRRRDDFVRACPDLVIVDEAHTCAAAGDGSRARQQRHALVHALANDPNRHLILVTATPHSGKDESFRSLLTLLDPDFAHLPDVLAGEDNRRHRERLAQHLVQRRRADLRHYLEQDTSFPERSDDELTYTLSASYRELFDDVLAYARQTVREPGTGRRQQRVRWWSALGLLRAMASSPAAAAATMRTRASNADADTDADEIGRQAVLDLDEAEEAVDVVPGAQSDAPDSAFARQLRQLADRADALAGDDDAKLLRAVDVVATLVADGYHPIVFCRFIDTAEYIAAQLRRRLPGRLGADVEAVTGRLPTDVREQRIAELATHERRVLVATDCLSEGINLQDHFSAVVHYDLPWNPTRLEQREGRVDRFGQAAPSVRVLTYYGADNYIDETVLEVLLRKHRAIRGALGISIPVPGSTNTVIEALAENVLLRSDEAVEQRLPGFDEFLRPPTEQLHLEWDAARDRESSRRSLFAQQAIDPDAVAAELHAMQAATGSGAVVADFVAAALRAHGAIIATDGDRTRLDLREVGRPVRDAMNLRGDPTELYVSFEPPVGDGVTLLSRTHPAVAGLAAHVLDAALDPVVGQPSARCGVTSTAAVSEMTTLLLCRFRVNLTASSRSGDRHLLAEEAAVFGFSGLPDDPTWLGDDAVEQLLAAEPAANVSPAAQRRLVIEALTAAAAWRPHLDTIAADRADAVAAAHRRVRESDRRRGATAAARVTAIPHLPVDVLGIFVLIPVVG